MATTADVERALRSLMKNLDGAAVPEDVPDRTLLCVTPDIQHAFMAHLRGGKLKNLKGVDPATQADVKISARSDDLIALIEGRLNVAFAFLTGKIRVDASASDLMMIRGLF